MGAPSRWTIALICAFLFVSFILQVSADPWWKRQQTQQTQQPNNPNNTNTNTNNTNNNAAPNNGNSSSTQQASGSAGPQPTGNQTTGGNSTHASNNTSATPSSVNGVGPAAIQLTTPSITQTTPLYKIGDNVTFAWEWLNQPVIKPKYLLVQCQSTIGKTWYQIANLSATATSCRWITAQQSPPLVMSDYTLYITDERGISAAPSAGRMQPFSGLIFAMYSPQSYTGLDGYTCATCNDGSFPFVPIFMTVGVTIITVITFGFFMV